MIQVYVDQISPRIEYTFEFIFGSRGLGYTLTENQNARVHLNYSLKKRDSVPTLSMASFMVKDKLGELNVSVESLLGLECFAFDGITDPIASIFYVLSRYEEYNNQNKDEYGRFPFSASKAPKEWALKAVCDRWAEAIISIAEVDSFKTAYPVKIIPSFDIDNTYAYKLKSGKRKWLSILKDIARFDIARLKERKAVLSRQIDDPYDTFQKIKSIYKRFPETKLFWLVGKWGKKDRNISIEIDGHRNLIKSLSESGINIGLHPSFGSFLDRSIIGSEKKELESVSSTRIVSTRQHFLRFRIPSTFSDLSSVGFTDEYSMGYAEHAGFRSGTARAHSWFDLSQNKQTSLIIHPFVYMDGTLREYMKLSIKESKLLIQELFDEVKRYGGDFIFIWHNETIGDYGNWKGWDEVLDFTLSLENESN